MQRWFVSSFIDERFSQCRHQCGDATMNVFSLSHGRSRELYDLTMLEVRRVLTTICRRDLRFLLVV